MQTRREAARILGWSAMVPFAGLLLMAILPTPDWLENLLIGYAVLILAFLGGTLWTEAIKQPEDRPAALFVSGLLPVVALPALVLPLFWSCFWLAVLYAGHWAAEWHWVRAAQPGWYRGLRLGLSGTAIGALLIAGLLLFNYG